MGTASAVAITTLFRARANAGCRNGQVPPRICIALPADPLFSFDVRQLRLFAKYWLWVLLWMALIFSASGDRQSFQRSRLIAPLVHWLLPQLSPEGVDQAVFLVRKLAHLTEYAILAMLLWRALRGPQNSDPLPPDWKQPGLVILLVALYAASDEFHQSFVPTRQGSLIDVFIDITGGILGLLFVLALTRWPQRR